MKKYIGFILINFICLCGYGQVNNQDAVIIAEKVKKHTELRSPQVKNSKKPRYTSVLTLESMNQNSKVLSGPKFKNRKHVGRKKGSENTYLSSKKVFSTGPKSKKFRLTSK